MYLEYNIPQMRQSRGSAQDQLSEPTGIKIGHLSSTLAGLDHKFAQDQPLDIVLRAQDHVLRRFGDLGTERGGQNYDQGPTCRA